jgi:hypothetical protein
MSRRNGSSPTSIGPPGADEVDTTEATALAEPSGAAPSRRRVPAAVIERITVSLVGKAAADLRRTHTRTRLSKTDIVNRAVSLYEFIDDELSRGAELIVKHPGRPDHVIKLF